MTHVLGNKRKIDGKTYTAVSYHHTKKNAEIQAGIWRRKGYSIRIIPTKSKKYGKEYYLWRR